MMEVLENSKVFMGLCMVAFSVRFYLQNVCGCICGCEQTCPWSTFPHWHPLVPTCFTTTVQWEVKLLGQGTHRSEQQSGELVNFTNISSVVLLSLR